jgi:hypothetical protein
MRARGSRRGECECASALSGQRAEAEEVENALTTRRVRVMRALTSRVIGSPIVRLG